jgi:hypothetical protein
LFDWKPAVIVVVTMSAGRPISGCPLHEWGSSPDRAPCIDNVGGAREAEPPRLGLSWRRSAIWFLARHLNRHLDWTARYIAVGEVHLISEATDVPWPRLRG